MAQSSLDFQKYSTLQTSYFPLHTHHTSVQHVCMWILQMVVNQKNTHRGDCLPSLKVGWSMAHSALQPCYFQHPLNYRKCHRHLLDLYNLPYTKFVCRPVQAQHVCVGCCVAECADCCTTMSIGLLMAIASWPPTSLGDDQVRWANTWLMETVGHSLHSYSNSP